jgi:hypothetical protein
MCVVVAVVLLVGVWALASWWFGDPLNLLRLGRLLVFESSRSHALDERTQLLDHCLEMRTSAIQEIFAGRMTLRQAAIRFQEADDLIENNAPDLVATYQKPRTEEAAFRQVLAWVRLTARARSSAEAERVVERTRAEFFELFPSAAPPEAFSTIIEW